MCLLVMLIVPHAATIAFALPQHAGRTHTRKQITVGDITVSDFASSRVAQGEAGFHISGPATYVTVPDAQHHSTLVLHAGEIDGKPEGKDPAGILEVSDRITFTIIQDSGGSRRHISGSAGHISYRRSEGLIHLNSVVHITVTDVSALSGPATITAATAVVDLKAAPYRLVLDGPEQLCDIVFSPRPKPGDSSDNVVHISKFAHGEFQPGVSADFRGKEVCAELDARATGDKIVLYSASLTSLFERTILNEIRSDVPVKYHAEQRNAGAALEQSADGAAGKAALLVAGKRLTLQGGSHVRLYNRAQLTGPGTLQSGTATLDLNAKPYQYSADGSPETNSLEFTLAPGKDGKQIPVSVHVFGYSNMRHVTERSVEFSGQSTMLDVAQQTPKRTTHVICSNLTVVMGIGNQSVERIEARNHVRFDVSTPITKTVDRELTGTADSAVITLPAEISGKSNPDGRQSIVLHVVTCKLVSPDRLIGPATLRGTDLEQISAAGKTHVTVTGSQESTDILIPMRAGSTPAAVGAPVGANEIHLYKFKSTTWNEDGSVVELGAGASADLQEPFGGRSTHVEGDRLELAVDAKSKSPTTAMAVGHAHIISVGGRVQKAGINPAKQRLDASAASVTYSIPTKLVELKGAVTGRLADSVRLAEPCDIAAESVSIGLQEPYSTMLIHAPDVKSNTIAADVRMAVWSAPAGGASTAKGSGANKSLIPRTAIRLHLYRFRNAHVQVGVGASADGPGTELDAARTDGRWRMTLTAESVAANFAPDGTSLQSAAADGGIVQFNLQSVPKPQLSRTQTLDGTAAKVEYLADFDQLRVSGHVNATFIDPQTLASPGTLRADSVVIDTGQPQFLYTCSGERSVNDIEFTMLPQEHPKSATVAAAKTAPPDSVPTQTRVHAYGFDSGVLQTGSAVTLAGPGCHLDVAQQQKHSHSEISAPHITADLSSNKPDESGLSNARAEGGVKFTFALPTVSGLAEQSYSGYAASIDYRMMANQQIDMTGRLSVKIVDPEQLLEPGLVEGLEGRVFHLTLTKGVAEYSYDSAGNAITVLLRPRRQVPKPAQESRQNGLPNSNRKAP